MLEVGFGPARNLPHCGENVRSVLAVEPANLAWDRAQEPINDFSRPVERVGIDGARLPVSDASVHAVELWLARPFAWFVSGRASG